MKKFEEVVEMYIDWSYGRNDDISMDDVLDACYDYGYDYDEVVEVGDAEAQKLEL